ncbi:MAG: GNAT family N-acetyltransferase [Rhodothermales bacterium]
MHPPDEHLVVRPYMPADRATCLALLAGNTPRYFLPSDRDDYARFLDALPGPYVVIEHEGAMCAAGGWAMDPDGVAVLTWGLVDTALHRRGIGTRLVRHRLDAMREAGVAGEVRLHTIPQVQGFYEKLGFRVEVVAPDGFGPGFDRVTMGCRL